MDVAVAGGGIGAMEALLGLHALAAGRVRTTLVAPDDTTGIGALRTLSTFTHRRPATLSLRALVRRCGAQYRPAAVRRVVADRRLVELTDGSTLRYDALVLAVGARKVPAFDQRVVTFGAELTADDLEGALRDVIAGYARSIAFVVPPGTTWPLPIYELALLAVQRLRRAGATADLSLVTPEPAPLAIFGQEATRVVGETLAEAGITAHAGAEAELSEPGRLRFAGGEVRADLVIALPRLIGPALHGVPGDADGFVEIDDACRVRGLPDVFAVGDATTFPVKQGGLACQMADAVVEQLAARAGAPVTPQPFRPVLAGQLLAGGRAGILHAGEDVEFRSVFQPSRKVEGRFLSELLAGEPGFRDTVPGLRIDVPLPRPAPGPDHPLAAEPYAP